MTEEYQCPSNILLNQRVLTRYVIYLLSGDLGGNGLTGASQEAIERTEYLSESLVGLLAKHIPLCGDCRKELDEMFKEVVLFCEMEGGTYDRVQEIEGVRQRICGKD